MAKDGIKGPRPIELLAPAKNVEVAREAILHGADAVYIGASSHGARKSAANSISELAALVDFAHQFRVKVYVTVNTIVYENELKGVSSLISRLWQIGVDAIIVQDMGILRLDVPPIELHASTQCDTRTVAKARFLQDAGFSQIVLARELSLDEIRDICDAVTVPVECFVHGALCVSYSGRCHISYASCGRSANRGECAQFCRLPYTLRDADGKIIAKDKHLLSLKDFNTSADIPKLLEAGVSSFKIEGRLKDAAYVKNITAYYRRIIDKQIALHPELYKRSSCGVSEITFNPQADHSFNRGFTNYFLNNRRPTRMASLDSPKSAGETIDDVSELKNGDGISFRDKKGNVSGAFVNAVNRDGSIMTSSGFRLPAGVAIRRTFNKEWEKKLSGTTASRRILVDFFIDLSGVSASDERGNHVRIPLDVTVEKAQKPQDFKQPFKKLGNTIYRLGGFQCDIPEDTFIPVSKLTDLRRRILSLLDEANRQTYPIRMRRKENKDTAYPCQYLTYADNVANFLAAEFYKQHGVKRIDKALESSGKSGIGSGKVVMTTRYCMLRELGICLKQVKQKLSLPLTIESGNNKFLLRFCCDRCEMEVITV